MLELENKIKNWYKGMREPKITFERKGIRPNKDWNRIIFSSFFIICILGGMAFYFYLEVDKGTFFSIPEEEMISEVKINNNLLNKVIDGVNSRENDLREIKVSKKAPENPSI